MLPLGQQPARTSRVQCGFKDGTTPKEEALAGLVVALASVPSSVAFASIAGVNPLIGIWSSVVLGFVCAVVGGRPGLIAGSAGVVVVPLAPLIMTHGVAYMTPCLILAAAIEAAFAALQLGRFVSVVDDNVMNGFLNGLGCLLIKSQLATFGGLAGAAFGWAVGVAAIAATITKFLPLLTTAVPAALVAVIVSTLGTAVLKLPISNLADVAGTATFQGGLSVLPTFAGLGWLALPGGALATMRIVAPAAVSIALISVLETLLAGKVVEDCVASECMVFIEQQPPAKNNQLLGGLAAGNAASALLGGFGGSGLIPQTLLNMQCGGHGRLSSISYAIALAALVVAAAPLIGAVPVAALAGVMLTVALSTVQFYWTCTAFDKAFRNPAENVRQRLRACATFCALAVTSTTCYFVDSAPPRIQPHPSPRSHSSRPRPPLPRASLPTRPHTQSRPPMFSACTLRAVAAGIGAGVAITLASNALLGGSASEDAT